MEITFNGCAVTNERIGPERAKEFLKHNLANRRLRPAIVDSYSRDMASGAWVWKPIAICFDEDGNLVNGQHTLSAVVKSGTEHYFLVARKVPRASVVAMDIGLTRTINDIAHFVGDDISGRKAAVARIVVWGADDTERRSFSEILDAYRSHKEAIDFVCDVGNIVGYSAPVLAALARAYYTKSKLKIARFLEIGNTGIPEGPHEEAAVRLRDFCRSGKAKNSLSGRVELYRKTQSALVAFLDGNPISKVYGFQKERFPIPEASA